MRTYNQLAKVENKLPYWLDDRYADQIVNKIVKGFYELTKDAIRLGEISITELQEWTGIDKRICNNNIDQLAADSLTSHGRLFQKVNEFGQPTRGGEYITIWAPVAAIWQQQKDKLKRGEEINAA